MNRNRCGNAFAAGWFGDTTDDGATLELEAHYLSDQAIETRPEL